MIDTMAAIRRSALGFVLVLVIFGVLPLAFATGAAAESRKTIGWTVFGGMLAATTLAIFVVPVLFVMITKLSYGKKLKRIESERMAEHSVDKSILESGT